MANYYVRLWTERDSETKRMSTDAIARNKAIGFGHLVGPYATRAEANRKAKELARSDDADPHSRRYTEVMSDTALIKRVGELTGRRLLLGARSPEWGSAGAE